MDVRYLRKRCHLNVKFHIWFVWTCIQLLLICTNFCSNFIHSYVFMYARMYMYYICIYFCFAQLTFTLIALYCYMYICIVSCFFSFFYKVCSPLGSLRETCALFYHLRSDCLGRPTYTKLGRFVNTIHDTTFTFLVWLASLDFSLSHFQPTARRTQRRRGIGSVDASYSDTNANVSKTYTAHGQKSETENKRGRETEVGAHMQVLSLTLRASEWH